MEGSRRARVRDRARAVVLGIVLCSAGLAVGPVRAPALTDQEAIAVGIEAYVYGYPLVTMDMTRRVMTNVVAPDGARAPMGQFAQSRTYPTAAFKDVTAPNADTLYSTAWLDVSREPYVLSIPNEDGRYFLMPMLSGWTDVFEVPGKRTTGTKAQKYLISGPNWNGTVPPGVTHYASPTAMVWILGRTYCTGTPEDYQAVHAIQDQYSLVPLSAYGTPYTPPPGSVDPSIDMTTAVRAQVDALDAGTYFNRLALLMQDNPPAKADAPMVAKLQRLGIAPGQPFDIRKADPAVARALPGVPKAALERIAARAEKAGRIVNRWVVTTKTGVYGTDYLQRAAVTAIGLGANRPQDAVYPFTALDGDGNQLNGAKSHVYAMKFRKDQLPPVKGFWSLTMYNSRYFFVPNPLNRYTLSDRDPLKRNPDGSVYIIIQAASPGPEWESNWLPAPADDFILMLRLYWPAEPPKRSIINGTWKPPPVDRIR